MPARKQIRRISAFDTTPSPETTEDDLLDGRQRRADQVLRGGTVRMVIEAAVAVGGAVEVETDGHIATITVSEK